MPGIWEILIVGAFLAWMIVPFFMKKRRNQERRDYMRREQKRYYDSVEELDDTSYEVMEDE